jgi:hypothetical protein
MELSEKILLNTEMLATLLLMIMLKKSESREGNLLCFRDFHSSSFSGRIDRIDALMVLFQTAIFVTQLLPCSSVFDGRLEDRNLAEIILFPSNSILGVQESSFVRGGNASSFVLCDLML